MIDRVDVLDLASEIDLQKMERLMSIHKDHRFEVIYSPYILLVWEDQFNTTHVSYFEKQSKTDMKLVEDIINLRSFDRLVCQKVIHQNFNVQFPFAVFKWSE